VRVVFEFLGIVGGGYVLYPLCVFIGSAHGRPVDVGEAGLLEQGFGQFHAGRHGVVTVYDGEVYVLAATRQIGGFHFHEFDIFGVFGNIGAGGAQRVDTLFQFNPAQVVKHYQSTGEVRRIVGDGNGAAVFHLIQCGELAGVDAQRSSRHLEYFGQVEVVFGLEGVQIRFVLENVDVDRTLGQCLVGGNVVGELGKGNSVALFFQHGLDLVFNHVGKVARGGAEADFPLGFGGGLGLCAPQHGFYAGDEFARAEGFADVVVCAEFEAEDAVGFFVLGGEHDDGLGVLRAQGFEQFEAVGVGQADVEQEQVEVFAREQLPCLLCGGGDACGEMGAGEGEFDQFGDFAFVFDDEDMRVHGIGN